MPLHPRHAELLDYVNHARDNEAHALALARLEGWRDGMRDADRRIDLCAADLYYLAQGIDRPMCGGIWLDWKPAPYFAETPR